MDLELTPSAGGHVKFWRNIAAAAATYGCDCDLTVHFQGDAERHTHLAEGVRIVTLPPALSTARLAFLSENPDHADLAPYHRRLARALASYDVVHTTDAYFAYAKTAGRVVDETRQTLVTSIHTDTPAYTRVYAERAFRNLFRNGRLAERIVDRWHWPEIAEARMRRALDRHLRASRHVWIAPNDDVSEFEALKGSRRVSTLPRGVDGSVFSPDRRDRERLSAEFGFDRDDFVLIFAGRIDVGKQVMVAAEAVRRMVDRGQRVKLILAGRGGDAGQIRDLLGSAVRLPGFVDQDALGWMLASSDAFVFPSQIETAASAAIEARAAGLPVLVTPTGAGHLVRRDWVDGIVLRSQAPDEWARAVERLMSDPDLARKMGALANVVTAETQPSWHEVLARDLAPVWRRVASKSGELR